MKTTLLLEDDFTLATEISQFLHKQSYQCDVVYDGGALIKQLKTGHYDIYILDINVPTMNGFEVCKLIREKEVATPILMLTAYGAVEDKVKALEYGADDYLVKPFHFDELNARIKALIRRSGNVQRSKEDLIQVADLKINKTEMLVTRNEKKISLTPKEYKLLELLALAAGKTVSRQTIVEQVWDINFETGTNTVEVYINFLRNKIDKGFSRKLIHTRSGYGYYLNAEEIK